MILVCFMTMSISLIMMMSSHPVSILAIILIQTTLICVNMWMLTKTSWFSYILFLIFLGGLMILFVYIVSLASNEKFEMDINKSKIIFITISFLTLWYIFSLHFEKPVSFLMKNLFSQTMLMFTENLMIPTLLIMFYLLFTLIVAVKVASKFEGPLRNMT